MTRSLLGRLPSSRVFALERRRKYARVRSTNGFATRGFGHCSTFIFVNTVKVYIHAVTPYIGGGCASPTIVYISDANGFTVSMLSKRVKKTGRLARRMTGVLKTRPMIAARDSYANL